MNSARVLIRQGDIGKYTSFWATVREMGDKIEERLGIYSFCCYDTKLFKTASQACFTTSSTSPAMRSERRRRLSSKSTKCAVMVFRYPMVYPNRPVM